MIQSASPLSNSPTPTIGGPPAIACRNVSKRFGRTLALNGLDITVPTGSVYALLGRNGTGKSTLIQLLMGMLEPSSGLVDVLGLNPARDDIALKQRVGYIPERLPMYDWMTVEQTLRFVAPFYPEWSADDEQSLVARFRIDRAQKVGALSRGYRALLSLVIAMAHRPDLVLLDECTSGMDAIARREFERSVIDSLQVAGRTVLFAGHQIDEMERICDWVGVIHNGRMLVELPLDELKDTVTLLRVASDDPPDLTACTVLSQRRSGRESSVTVRLDQPGVAPQLPTGATLLETIPLTLEEIFVALVEAEEQQ